MQNFIHVVVVLLVLNTETFHTSLILTTEIHFTRKIQAIFATKYISTVSFFWCKNYHIEAIWRLFKTHYNTYTIVWFLRAPRWYMGPTAMPRAAVTLRSGAIGCDSHPWHCRRDDMPAWRPNKIMLLSLLPLNLAMYHRFISFLHAAQSREGR